ncbi:MAG: sulfatase-like hydrolase/transferase [Bacilli bacterium]|nr:sulfatase-like hydrolase/transferase [Bacilli bacterium]
MDNSIVLLSKDILMNSYLPVYGNTYWETPNINELAEKGTVFNRHYTTAPSTAMAFTSMFTGKYPYELNRKKYVEVEKIDDDETLFGKLQTKGFENHIIWGIDYTKDTIQYTKCYGDENKTIFHNLYFGQGVGPHFFDKTAIKRDEVLATKTVAKLKSTIEDIVNLNKKVFLWIHLPHVMLGRESYGSDIDLLDDIIGFLRTKFTDNSIFITADHGNMNGKNGIFAYGFDVYEPAIRIPLITPKIENYSLINFPTSNTQLETIILNRTIKQPNHVISDSAYYAQPHRKTAIIKENYKYIFNKKSNKEELYDLEFDPQEDINLLNKNFKDPYRKVTYKIEEVYYYPHIDKVESILKEMKEIKDTFWKVGSVREELFYKFRKVFSIIYNNLKTLKKEILKK